MNDYTFVISAGFLSVSLMITFAADRIVKAINAIGKRGGRNAD